MGQLGLQRHRSCALACASASKASERHNALVAGLLTLKPASSICRSCTLKTLSKMLRKRHVWHEADRLHLSVDLCCGLICQGGEEQGLSYFITPVRVRETVQREPFAIATYASCGKVNPPLSSIADVDKAVVLVATEEMIVWRASSVLCLRR